VSLLSFFVDLKKLNFDFAGFLFETTGSYQLPFLVAGGLITLSAILTYPLKIVKTWQQKRENRRKIAIAA
jgi:hypothetical protein